MKLKSILSMAAAGLILASCSTPEGKSLDQISNASKADSLIYYFGQLRGAEYKHQAENDTVLSSAAAQQEYLRGVKAGLDAVKADKEAYNRGLGLGMQMALSMNQFKEEYGVELSSKLFLESLTASLNSDSTINTSELQANFYRLMNAFSQEKEERDRQEATSALESAAKSKGMTQLTPDLWGTPSNDGQKIKEGDRVKLDITLQTLQGKDIEAPFPKEYIVGKRMQTNPLNVALTSMSSGESAKFLTSASALFGVRCSQLGLKPADILSLVITATVTEAAPAEKENSSTPAGIQMAQ